MDIIAINCILDIIVAEIILIVRSINECYHKQNIGCMFVTHVGTDQSSRILRSQKFYSNTKVSFCFFFFYLNFTYIFFKIFLFFFYFVFLA